MSTVSKPQQPVKVTPKPAATPATEPYYGTQPAAKPEFLFGKENYMLMIGGLALILIGFALMAGGKSPDPHKFNYDEIYSFRRITLAPIVVLIGFVVEVFAIMRKPKDEQAV
jgi:hypothetical protein